MMNKNGFSSKELIAVIVMVSMLACAIVSVMLDSIKTSNAQVIMNNVRTFRSNINVSLMSYINDGSVVDDGCYYVTKSGDICLGEYDKDNEKCLSESLEVDLDEKKPVGGIVDIAGNCVENIHNIKMDDVFINIDKNAEYYISVEPKSISVCIR